ncbi:MAG: hypothetical protein A3B30_01400 [Candidatus Komeilibacteria bacterium RIFCSPLOWO2_01_FULL_52_15]|uniref:Glutamyl-tRNA amidotransferase n=1 Tax=Candidatus Komeilibacteria bacterium RIFCSPLOWO2_01_FULL_52_15 TaxID=1798551 RepID=A0A1G2BP34_9BACT|nr:MAG: hypothetical protein A3B30_01400 [Candidatus Komeilibacteria bacterium RIFCSPLOWO2_01_FULL_52_15]
MQLIHRIEQDLLVSLKAREQERIGALRMLKNALKNFAIEKRTPMESLTDEQVVSIVRQEVKRRKESMFAFESGGRLDLVARERAELGILETYLPPALAADDLEAVIREVVAERKLSPPYQFGAVMGPVVKKIAGRADGTTVKAAVEAFIAKSA